MDRDRARGIGPARSRRCRILDGQEGLLPAAHRGRQVCLCCNADESRAGAFRIAELMQRNPHQLIGRHHHLQFQGPTSAHAFIFIRGEYDDQADILRSGGR